MSSNPASSSTDPGSADPSAARRNSKRPKYSRFTQQELPACKPILTPRWVISAFLLVSVVFIPIGVASLFASRDVVEIVHRYDDDCVPGSKSDKIKFIQGSADKTCNRTLKVSKHMKAPIYIYYQLDNFYQNHRRYVKSRSDQQLRSKKSETAVSACKPEDMINGKAIVPCGLIAWSLFNDTYSFSLGNKNLTVNKKGISWKSDRDHKFGKDVFPKNFQKGGLRGGATLNESIPLSEQEDLIVWMRTAALPTFRKLYGRIEQDLNANDEINVTLKNYYNTYSFNGKKMLVLSTTSWLGGKNDFLGIAYLTVGGLCFFLSLLFTVIYLFKPRRLGDPSYLSWNRNPGGR
ncbi:hypothetical protein RND81_10G185700 [Saponaria officinalis]|uniref:ALA-interacting subunit n=1 Tax=Saponaria officinalis TaxID=3572 RepID=A0AAW1I3M0_SAPOF